MPYTRAWDEDQPAGSEDPGTIDDIIRAFKQDIRERMEHVVVDWDADPVVPIPPTSTTYALTDQVLYLPIMAGDNDRDDNITLLSAADGIWVQNETQNPFTTYVPIILPVGATIKNAGVFGRRVDGTETIELSVYCVSLANPQVRTLLGIAAGIGGTNVWAWADIGAVEQLIAADQMYLAVVVATPGIAGTCHVSAVRVVYDSPSASVRI